MLLLRPWMGFIEVSRGGPPCNCGSWCSGLCGGVFAVSACLCQQSVLVGACSPLSWLQVSGNFSSARAAFVPDVAKFSPLLAGFGVWWTANQCREQWGAFKPDGPIPA